MYGRQPHHPVDVTLGLVLPNLCKKAKLFQAKEAWHHKLNYNKHSRAQALEVGDMVLVYVTAFKGHHKMQD